MALTYDGTNGITFNDGTQMGTANALGMRNRIINGAMTIDQRNAGSSLNPTAATPVYSLDRWIVYQSVASKFTAQQNAGSVTPPVGFTNYLGITSSSAYSVGSTDEFDIQQRIEGYNIADLAWGTSGAKSVTLSFQVYSSLTGTFSGAISNNAANRCYVFSYTISSANTWIPISITIPGDITGTWVTNNGIGARINFSLGAGSSNLGTAGTWGSTYYVGATGTTSVVGTNGATFYITGVQLEKGSVATPFDYRHYTTELQLCQRYFTTIGGPFNGNNQYQMYGIGVLSAVTQAQWIIQFPVNMRAFPSLTTINIGNFTIGSQGASVVPTSLTLDQYSYTNMNVYTANPSIGSGSGYACRINGTTNTNQIQISAEL